MLLVYHGVCIYTCTSIPTFFRTWMIFHGIGIEVNIPVVGVTEIQIFGQLINMQTTILSSTKQLFSLGWNPSLCLVSNR